MKPVLIIIAVSVLMRAVIAFLVVCGGYRCDDKEKEEEDAENNVQ